MNRVQQRIFRTTLVAGGLIAAFLVGNWVSAQAPVPAAPAAFKPEKPANRGLDANLYMQTSAEYRACCYQAYNLATLRLKDAVRQHADKKLAVVLDLDETVVDNAGFQAMQLRSNLAYDQRLWDHWEKDHAEHVGLIPGAKEFILEAGKLGVTVAYISNRNDKFRDQTKKLLAKHGISAAEDSLLKLSTDTSDKTKRRKEVEKEYTVVLYVGDNLRDFDDSFRCRKFEKKTPEEISQAIKERKETTDKHQSEWGNKWIVLPCPAYGEWLKPLGEGENDLDQLAPPIGK
ncbi:MAG: HAD family acid phosphatase [Zavarzinella sp.]